MKRLSCPISNTITMSEQTLLRMRLIDMYGNLSDNIIRT